MGLIAWILFGALAGWLASILMGTNEKQGIFGNIVLGILGAVLGGFIVNALGGNGAIEFDLFSLLVAIGGASLITWMVQKLA